MRPAPPPLTIERGELPLPGLVARQARGDGGAATQAESRQPPAGQSPAPAKVGPDGTAAERPTDPFEVVSMCGAHEEGHALLAARAWHGPLLAAPRQGGDAARVETARARLSRAARRAAETPKTGCLSARERHPYAA